MLKSTRILVVEDDPQMADIIQWNLRVAGFSVKVVQDGLSAMLAFDRERPSLVTIDLNVPAITGFRLVEVFKRHEPSVPVIVVTGLTFEEAEEIAHSGADDFVGKPFEPEQLVQKIRYHLDRSQAARPLVPQGVGSDSRRELFPSRRG